MTITLRRENGERLSFTENDPNAIMCLSYPEVYIQFYKDECIVGILDEQARKNWLELAEE